MLLECDIGNRCFNALSHTCLRALEQNDSRSQRNMTRGKNISLIRVIEARILRVSRNRGPAGALENERSCPKEPELHARRPASERLLTEDRWRTT